MASLIYAVLENRVNKRREVNKTALTIFKRNNNNSNNNNNNDKHPGY